MVNSVWVSQLEDDRRDLQFKESFRMSYVTFHDLCQRLAPYIARQDTRFRKAITVHHRVAVAVYRLAHGTPYRALAQSIGVSKTSCSDICTEVYAKICQYVQPDLIKLPTGQDLVNNLKFFHSIKGFPMCLGAIDGSHIPIRAPRDRPDDYYNRKGFHSIVLQGTVDFYGKFVDINVGWPGRAHDARIFKNSSLYRRMTTAPGLYPDLPFFPLNGIKIRPYFMGDAAYGIEKTCMKGFTGHNLTDDQEWFNYKLSAARMVVEKAYGRLKERWRILYIPLDNHSVKGVCDVVGAACVLHNMVELERSAMDLIKWNYHSDRFQQPGSPFMAAILAQEVVEATLGEPVEGTPEQIRAALCTFLARMKPADWKAPGNLS